MSLLKATETDDELKGLRELRKQLAIQMDDCDSKRDFASLAIRLADTLARITEIKSGVPTANSALDEITSRRERRKPIRSGVKREA